MNADTFETLVQQMRAADARYGNFSSTHEALGVLCEEWDELREAIRSNDAEAVQAECLDLASVLLRLHDQLEASAELRRRSGME